MCQVLVVPACLSSPSPGTQGSFMIKMIIIGSCQNKPYLLVLKQQIDHCEVLTSFRAYKRLFPRSGTKLILSVSG